MEPISQTLGTCAPFDFCGSNRSNTQTITMSKARCEKHTITRLVQNQICGVPHGTTKISNVIFPICGVFAALWEFELAIELRWIVHVLHGIHSCPNEGIQNRSRSAEVSISRGMRLQAIWMAISLPELVAPTL